MAAVCQSCSMPMKKDKEGGGSEADGSRSTKYCSLCYQDGSFVHPEFDARQMQDFCVEQLRANGMPRFMAWLFTRQIPKLERWRE